MLTINGREATDDEIADLVGSLMHDEKRAEELRGAECEPAQREGFDRLALAFERQAMRERTLAEEIEE